MTFYIPAVDGFGKHRGKGINPVFILPKIGVSKSSILSMIMSDRSKNNLIMIKISITLYQTIPTFNDPKKEAIWKHSGKRRETIWKHSGKRRNAGNQHFLLSPQCFLPIPKHISIAFNLSSTNAFNLDSPTFVIW